MGGCSYRIWGEVDSAALDDVPAAPSTAAAGAGLDLPDLDQPLPPPLRRLLESLPPRQAIAVLSAYTIDPQRALHEPGARLAAQLVAPLLADFGRYLDQQLPRPWPATVAVREGYLATDPPALYVRQSPDGQGWCVQLHLTGQSGMGLVSAALAAHWIERWFCARRDWLGSEVLQPAGFRVGNSVETLGLRFAPTPTCGYAQYVGAVADREEDAIDARHRAENEFDSAIRTLPRLVSNSPLVIDRARHRALPDPSSLEGLGARLGEQMRDGRCRCQLCAPDFDLTALEAP